MSDINDPGEYDPGEESGAAAGVISGDEDIGDGIVGGSTYGADDLQDDETDEPQTRGKGASSPSNP